MAHRTVSRRDGTLLAGTLAGILLLGVGCPGTRETPAPPPGGAYRSDDGGRTWAQKVRRADGGDITRVTPLDVVVDPFAPGTVYVAAGAAGLLRTEDAAELWDAVPTPTAAVTSVVVHPRNPNILFIAGVAEDAPDRRKIWKSFDRGETWTEVFTESRGRTTGERDIFRRPREIATNIAALAVDPARPEVLVAGSSSGALIVSTDGGGTWSTRRSFTQGISGLKLSPTAPDQLFVRLGDGTLARSDDGGRTAERVSVRDGETRATAVHALLFTGGPGGGDAIFAGTDRGLFVTRDAGETWRVVPLPVSTRQSPPIRAVAQSADGRLWAGSNFTLSVSWDGGVSWRVEQFDVDAPLRFILADPVNARRLYVFFLPGGESS